MFLRFQPTLRFGDIIPGLLLLQCVILALVSVIVMLFWLVRLETCVVLAVKSVYSRSCINVAVNAMPFTVLINTCINGSGLSVDCICLLIKLVVSIW